MASMRGPKYARSTWSAPVTLEEAATFGDEGELILWGLALIDRPPTCGASLTASDPSEVMMHFGDVLGENVSRAAGEDSENESEHVASGGYGGSERGEGPDKDQVEVAEVMQEASDVGRISGSSTIPSMTATKGDAGRSREGFVGPWYVHIIKPALP